MTSKAHLAFFASSLPTGAIQDVLANLAVVFAERGHRCDLVTARLDEPTASPAPGVRVIDLAPLSTRMPWVRAKRRRWLPGSAPALASYLRRETPAALLAGGLYANLAALWARDRARSNTRIVLCEQNPLSRACRNPGRIKLTTPLLVRRSYPRADAIVACSGGVADDMADFTGIARKRITAIHNPVVTPTLRARAGEGVDHPWFAPSAPPVILSVARLAVQKDFPTLLRAFARVRSKRPARLLILGEGKQRGALEQLARELELGDDVSFAGFTPNPLPYMQRSQVFALSSIYEGFGNVLIEALFCGLPVVSTDSPGGPSEILDRGRFGRLVPVGDAEGFADALLGALDEPLAPELLRARAEDFSAERIADRYAEVLLR